MIRQIQIFSAALVLLFLIAPFGNAVCQPVVRAEDNSLLSSGGKSRGPAVISSTSVLVPQLKLRLVDEKNQVQPKEITVTYNWQWWEYPYPEHAWGAWSNGYDFVKCMVETDETVMTVPEYTVTPRGWYKGKYVNFPWPRKPKFNGVNVRITAAVCDSAFGIERSDLEQYQGKIAVIQLSCSQRPKISFTDK